jgi:FixJ family two-component response regulator
MKTVQSIQRPRSIRSTNVATTNPSICIAVVDDDMMYRQAIEVSLKKVPGSRVLGFESGEHCFKHYHQVKPDILVLDYNLCTSQTNEAMNGIEILRKVRQINDKATVIFLTGVANTDVAVAAIKAGATDFITKDKNGLPRLLNQVRKAAIKVQVKRQEMRVARWIAAGVICISAIVMATIVADTGGFSDMWNWLWFGLSLACGIVVIRAWVRSSRNDNDHIQTLEYTQTGKWID